MDDRIEKIVINENIKNHSFADINYFRDIFNSLPMGKYQVYVTKSAIRSPGLNAYYWGVIIDRISEYTGQGPMIIHEELKKRFNPRSKQNIQGNALIFGGSTRKQNNGRFWIYCLRCLLWALDTYNIDIPYPNDLTEDERLHVSNFEPKNSR